MTNTGFISNILRLPKMNLGFYSKIYSTRLKFNKKNDNKSLIKQHLGKQELARKTPRKRQGLVGVRSSSAEGCACARGRTRPQHAASRTGEPHVSGRVTCKSYVECSRAAHITTHVGSSTYATICGLAHVRECMSSH